MSDVSYVSSSKNLKTQEEHVRKKDEPEEPTMDGAEMSEESSETGNDADSCSSTTSSESEKQDQDQDQPRSKLALNIALYLAILLVGFTLFGVIIAIARSGMQTTKSPMLEVFGDQKEAKFFVGDGVCDDETNVEAFSFDGGDCCSLDCKNHVSTQATAFCNCKECLCYSISLSNKQIT